MAVQAGPSWTTDKDVNGDVILAWFSAPEALAEWPRDLSSDPEGAAAGEAAFDFLRNYEDRISGWSEPSSERTIQRIGQLQNMLDVLVRKGGYRNLALADMTARVIYVGLVRAVLSAPDISVELEQRLTRALNYEIPIDVWRDSVEEETGWTSSELEERERLWSGQIRDVTASVSTEEARQIQFYTLAYAATGGKTMKDEAFASIFRVLPDYYNSARTCNLMLMYTKIEYLFRYSLPAIFDYAKADPRKEHTEDNAWIRANVGTIQHAMLSAPNMAGVEEEIRGVVRSARQKDDLDARAGIVWKSQSGNSDTP
jgi:hypothetical protein